MKVYLLAFLVWLLLTLGILIMNAAASPKYVNHEELQEEDYKTHVLRLEGYTEPFYNTQIHFCGEDGPESMKFPDVGFCHDGKIFVLFEEKDLKGKVIKYRERELEQRFYWKEDTGLQCDFAYVGDRCDVTEIKRRNK